MSSRGLTSGMQTAVAGGNFVPALFVFCDFSSGPVYVWTGWGSISWNGHTWTGLGDFIACDKIAEDAQVAARSLKLSLNGVPSSIITIAMTDLYRGRACQIFLGAFDTTTNPPTLISSPIQIFGGRMDVMTIRDAGDKCNIDLTVETRLIDLQRQRERRFTDADQKFFYPGDTGFQYVAGLQDQLIYWGQATPMGAGLPAAGLGETSNADR